MGAWALSEALRALTEALEALDRGDHGRARALVGEALGLIEHQLNNGSPGRVCREAGPGARSRPDYMGDWEP